MTPRWTNPLIRGKGDPNSPNYSVVFLGVTQANEKCLERNAASILGLEMTKMWSRDHSNKFEPKDGNSITSKPEAISLSLSLSLSLRGLSPHANYTDRAAAAGRRN